ncbi:hypothetical protein EO98_04650 [Methanosarcina sp. 2.H.T.1A.6]|uniref:hypothetical protein n=1 Tax=unclassified Methanosarcina TaxID=2644672 RepID=UPI00062161E0|nr:MULTISPECIES: hypothetical protein [unclassified Methanosarcina]KKG11627.1 hypothetical protein EO97_16320 [Methanosarcina sp. 2.H.T.1A.15]KKG15996.1 hypothetical protein EO94_05100 [Methanosarcina sp. 2.H.T.1A.3]KKG21018.1 hypothetical protein EO96_07025 [Methanosarcina sp. 2.H.T.1A.8]KKG21275.1 hypothetical protein EO98_04650 [Methanosarcina sp. 2.H.T.1A.6]
MSKEEILSRVLNILDLEKPDMSEFNTRLKFQKIVYLLQSSGLSLGYAFNWYVRGPYSPDLTQSLYSINDSLFENSKGIVFKDHEAIAHELNKFREKLGPNVDNVKYLEVLASMHYIWKVTFNGRGGKENLKIKLLHAKPSLKEFENIDQLIDEAYNDLKNYN